MSDELLYGYTFVSDAKSWLAYPELREHSMEMQSKHLFHKMEDEGYEPLYKEATPVLVEEIYYNLIDHGDDEDGEPIVEYVQVDDPEQATYIRRTIEIRCRKVKA